MQTCFLGHKDCDKSIPHYSKEELTEMYTDKIVPTSKSPEDVMEELEILMAGNFAAGSIEGSKYSADVNRKQIRSSLASVLCHMAEMMPKYKNASYKAWSEPKDPVEDLSGVENEIRSRRALAYNAAIDDCKAILINEAKKISNE